MLQAYLNNGQHTLIKAPKRLGNISLVKHVVEHLGGSSADAFTEPISPEYQTTQTESRDEMLDD